MSITIRAYAKINLCLEVLGRRADGMHEVATILQTIDLADRLRFDPDDDVSLRCKEMPVEPDNLILRAAHLLKESSGARAGCRIVCSKRIPIGAGLGGGSADAAATLLALNRLWDLGARDEELVELGAILGADVPFCVRGGTALATGIGAAIQPLPDAPPHWLVLVPSEAEEPAKTAEMYRSLIPDDFSTGEDSRRQAGWITAGNLDYRRVKSAFGRAAMERWPSVRHSIAALTLSLPLAASVSGAGPSVFALYPSRSAAYRARAAVRGPTLVRRFITADEVALTRYTSVTQTAAAIHER